ncbi:MAG TPA: MBL fold metallo-hydrolase [Polyangiaceae bacterium]|jgi:L-ascorbate metabolism protein UlaG (beta-lactamase superfamily)|nr:MAG: metal-dependent hydrolase [Deltaproteobacteria bacterium ADurb.Bin207]HNS96543.1 MBL fold metallo-hydrolase [Polyangiaceae bacterium]HNZ21531.1 MBL fold metallo-hydrolase [Polyangiaceae bacterium]HOD21670.1 MBL fold metallo-hydrolase [Polyangiaceae bacterium]HOE48171.1 MBL fold metallo-hydrolase [Polyangiaceae bacterium]
MRLVSGRFANLDGSVPQTFSSVFKWAVLDRILGRRRRSASRASVPVMAVDLERITTPPSVGARLTWLGHASWLVQLDGLSLLIDPVFSRSIGPGIARNVPAPLAAHELPGIAAQLVTHNHRDHLDLPSLRAVGSPIITGPGHRALFGTAVETTELDWWEATDLGPVRITFVPAQHWSRRGLWDANRGLWGGFVVRGSSATIYHAGDSAWFDGFSGIGKRFSDIDAALLPIGAYDPPWFMQKQHVSPEQAVRAFEELGARYFVAMHWGTFKLSDEPLDEPPLRLEKEWERRGFAREFLCIPAQGQTFEIGRGRSLG